MKAKYFFIGILAAFLALVLEFILKIIYPAAETRLIFGISLMIFAAVMIEEALKLALIKKTVKNILADPLLIGLGFASAEIALKMLNGPEKNFFFWPYLGVGLTHIAACLILGYSVAKKSFFTATIALFSAFILHLFFNLFSIRGTDLRVVDAVLFFIILIVAFDQSGKKTENLPF